MSLAIVAKVQRMKKEKEERRKRLQAKAIVKVNTIAEKPPFEEFASKLYIRSGSKLIPFAELYGYQKAIVELSKHYRGMVIVKDRQLGISELMIAFMLWHATYDPAYTGVSFSIGAADAHKLSKRAEFMPFNIEEFKWAIASLSIRSPEGGGELNFRPSTDTASRGLASVHHLFFDEAGFVPNISEMYAASSPSQEMVGEAARTYIVSTIPPAGKDCWFWNQFESGNPEDLDGEQLLAIARSGGHLNRTKAELPKIPGLVAIEDSSGWCKLIIGHKAHPIYGSDPNYVETQRVKKKLTLEQAHREHNLTLPSDRAGNPLINYFDEKKHVRAIEYDRTYPLHLSFDFNRHPATCLLGQQVDDRLIFFEEFYLLNSDTFALSKAVCDRVIQLQPPRLLIGGDASGKQKTANSQQSNWEIVTKTFRDRGLLFVRQWGESNPPIVDTVNSLNSLFLDDRAIVHPRCIELIKDLHKVEDDGKGGIDKKKDLMRGHLLDTARYLSMKLYPYRKVDYSWITDR